MADGDPRADLELLEPFDLEPRWINDDLVLRPREHGTWIRDALRGLGLESVEILDHSTDDVSEARARSELRIEGANEGDFDAIVEALAIVLTPDAILWDLDGVLADVTDSYRRAIVETAASYGVDLSLEEVSRYKAEGDANNDWILVQRILEMHGVDAEYDEIKSRYQMRYRGDGETTGLWRHETVIPDESLIEKLDKRVELGIVTGRTRESADRFLEHTWLDRYVEACVCMEDAPRKPSPEPVELLASQLDIERGWLIGDTPDDMLAAVRASVLPIGIVSPSDDVEAMEPALREAGAVRVLSDLEELLDLLP